MSGAEKPKAFTLREDGARAEWMGRLLATVGESTKSKAVWLAIRRYPELTVDVERLRRDLAEARRETETIGGELERIRQAANVLFRSAGVTGFERRAGEDDAAAPGREAGAALRGRASREDAEHFIRLGQQMAALPSDEGPPQDARELLARMCRLDPEKCGRGTENPQGGDWYDHLAYLEARQRVIDGRREREGGAPA